MDYTYDAFISYRHFPEEKAVAEKLEKMLERHKKKGGKRLSIFRDNSELSASPDLGAKICTALEQSRYLIILCSPQYLQSDWCLMEVECFRKYHGGNDRILTVLLEGEPGDVFPEVLCYTNRTVLDETGNPTMVREKVVPLGADIRADTNEERLKKLKVEHLRIAAPLLDITFDQLNQRVQRKKLKIAIAIIVALTAFSAYSTVLISQITRSKSLLEAKQQELYQNESVRLANTALELVTDNPYLAMLLTDTALPKDLANPEYPLTEEAELSVRSVALQHQLEDATEAFTLRSSIHFDNNNWKLGRFYEDGKYFTIHDWNKTWLFEAHTGALIRTLPGVECYFFHNMDYYVNQITTTAEDGTSWVGFSFGVTDTGEELGRCEEFAPALANPYPIYDQTNNKLWIADVLFDSDTKTSTYVAYGWFDANGAFHKEETLPAYLEGEQWFNDSHWGYNDYILSEGDIAAEYDLFGDALPEDYQSVVDAFNQYQNYSLGRGTSDTNNVYKISKSEDGTMYLLIYYYFSDTGLERTGTAFWAAEEDTLLWADEYWCFQESNSHLIYRILENELQILEANPENFSISRIPPLFEYVSDDGVYGFGHYDTAEEGYAFFAYDTSKLQDVRYKEEEGISYITQEGDYQLLTGAYRYDVTPDGTRMVTYTWKDAVNIYDVKQGRKITWANVSDENIAAVAINETGSLVAYASVWDQGFEIRLIDPDARKYVGNVSYTDAGFVNDEYGKYLEMSGDYLLLETSEKAFVYNLKDLEQAPWIIDLQDSFKGAGESPRASVFTDDGLLILPASDGTAYGNQMRVKAIFDLETKERINFYTTDIWHREYYYYDAAGGNLVQSYINEFVVQRRGESGNFETVYTIRPKHPDMELITTGHSGDGTWLLLQNEEYCEIYRLEDGQLCYMIRKPDDRNSQMAVIDGRLYDFCAGWNRSVALPTTEEARDYVRQTLTYAGFTRTLTDEEMQEYYIPSQWRENAA